MIFSDIYEVSLILLHPDRGGDVSGGRPVSAARHGGGGEGGEAGGGETVGGRRQEGHPRFM